MGFIEIFLAIYNVFIFQFFLEIPGMYQFQKIDIIILIKHYTCYTFLQDTQQCSVNH